MNYISVFLKYRRSRAGGENCIVKLLLILAKVIFYRYNWSINLRPRPKFPNGSIMDKSIVPNLKIVDIEEPEISVMIVKKP